MAIHPAVEEMTPAKANDYCKTLRFAGRLGCLPPESVLKKVKRNIFAVNEMLVQLGGTPFELNGIWRKTTDGIMLILS